MIIERKNEEIIVRLSSDTNTSDLQDMLDYFQYKELVSKSTATQADIDILSKDVNQRIWTRIRQDRGL
jgi:hypothetical protein